jgi:hypothetical protein
MVMLNDAVKDAGSEVQVFDITEIVAAQLDNNQHLMYRVINSV